MAEKTTITVQDAMRAAFAALLRGDTTERDRLVKQMEETFGEREVVDGDEPLAPPPKSS